MGAEKCLLRGLLCCRRSPLSGELFIYVLCVYPPAPELLSSSLSGRKLWPRRLRASLRLLCARHDQNDITALAKRMHGWSRALTWMCSEWSWQAVSYSRQSAAWIWAAESTAATRDKCPDDCLLQMPGAKNLRRWRGAAKTREIDQRRIKGRSIVRESIHIHSQFGPRGKRWQRKKLESGKFRTLSEPDNWYLDILCHCAEKVGYWRRSLASGCVWTFSEELKSKKNLCQGDYFGDGEFFLNSIVSGARKKVISAKINLLRVLELTVEVKYKIYINFLVFFYFTLILWVKILTKS